MTSNTPGHAYAINIALHFTCAAAFQILHDHVHLYGHVIYNRVHVAGAAKNKGVIT